MPEGPELYKASCLVNSACCGRIFTGKVIKSAVSKNSEVPFSAKQYTIRAEARGKEVALLLTPIKGENKLKSSKKTDVEKPLRILFKFGMSGKFSFGPGKDLHKHAHLNFYTNDKPPNVLSFVDVRRFGSWEVNDGWSTERGPDPMFEYQAFRSNVLSNMSDKCFNKSICETLLNQKYFNGIGNYLRAEILFRAKIPPFVTAKSVLEKLPLDKDIPDEKKKYSTNTTAYDLLELCHILPREVISLAGAGYDPEGNHGDYSTFMAWLQCYYNPEMRNLVDHDGRTIWFKGEAGPLAPKGGKSRGMVASRKRKSTKEGKDNSEKSQGETTVKKRKEKDLITNKKQEKESENALKKIKDQSNTKRKRESLKSSSAKKTKRQPRKENQGNEKNKRTKRVTKNVQVAPRKSVRLSKNKTDG